MCVCVNNQLNEDTPPNEDILVFLYAQEIANSIKTRGIGVYRTVHGQIVKCPIRFLQGFAICGESIDLAALWMKTLPNRSIMVRFILLKTTDLEIGEYIGMSTS